MNLMYSCPTCCSNPLGSIIHLCRLQRHASAKKISNALDGWRFHGGGGLDGLNEKVGGPVNAAFCIETGNSVQDVKMEGPSKSVDGDAKKRLHARIQKMSAGRWGKRHVRQVQAEKDVEELYVHKAIDVKGPEDIQQKVADRIKVLKKQEREARKRVHRGQAIRTGHEDVRKALEYAKPVKLPDGTDGASLSKELTDSLAKMTPEQRAVWEETVEMVTASGKPVKLDEFLQASRASTLGK